MSPLIIEQLMFDCDPYLLFIFGQIGATLNTILNTVLLAKFSSLVYYHLCAYQKIGDMWKIMVSKFNGNQAVWYNTSSSLYQGNETGSKYYWICVS